MDEDKEPQQKRIKINDNCTVYCLSEDNIVISDDEINSMLNNDQSVSNNQADVEQNEDEELKSLLESWNVGILYTKLAERGFNTNTLKLIKNSHLTEIFGTELRFFAPVLQFQESHSAWLNTLSSKNNELDVKEILFRNVDDVFEHYRTRGFLTDDHRKKIVNLILDEVFANHLNFTLKKRAQIAEQICKIFPKEDKTIYYVKKRGENAGGFLCTMYNTRLNSPKNKSPNVQSIQEELNNCLNDDVQNSITFLKATANNAIEDSPEVDANQSQLIIDHWKNTFGYRQIHVKISKKIDEVFAFWPLLKRSYGHVLIEMDFSKRYGDSITSALVTKQILKPYLI